MPFLPAYALDPRHEAHPPFARCAWIPLEQLAARVFELPQKSHHLRIANCKEAEAVERWLHQQGWRTEIVDVDFIEHVVPHCLWNPNPFMKEILHLLSGMHNAIDLGCGVGRDAVFMGMHGIHVLGIDRLPDAIKRARWLADHYMTEAEKPRVEWLVADVFDYIESRDHLDADLVVMSSFYDAGILDRVGDKLRVGAYILLDAFTEVHRDQFGRPTPPRCAPLHERLLPNFTEIMGDADWRAEGKHTRRALLQRCK